MIDKIDSTKQYLIPGRRLTGLLSFLSSISPDLWSEKVRGSSRRTTGMIASHIHNARCMWIKMIGKGKIVKIPFRVDFRRANRKEIIRALSQSRQAMLKLLKACIDNGGKLPSTPAWLNFPNDISHLLAYFVAHEGHHRGQIILLARQLNHQLPKDVNRWSMAMDEAIKRSEIIFLAA